MRLVRRPRLWLLAAVLMAFVAVTIPTLEMIRGWYRQLRVEKALIYKQQATEAFLELSFSLDRSPVADEDPSVKRERLSRYITSTYPKKFAATRVALEVMHGGEIIVSAHALPEERASALAEGWRVDIYRHRFPEPFAGYEAVFVTDYLPLSGKYGGAEFLELQVGTFALVVPIAFVGLYLSGAYLVRTAEDRAAFSAAISHELRTPLTSVKMHLEMLLSGMVSADGKREEYLKRSLSQVDRLSRLVSSALNISGVEKGVPEDAVECRVSEAVTICADIARQSATLFKLELTLAESTIPEPVYVKLSPSMIRSAIENLMENISKYAAPSDRRVEVVITGTTAGVHIAVRDFGPGVRRRELKRIFKPFVRGSGTKQTNGSGLGLAIVMSAAHASRGRVFARNMYPGLKVELELPEVASDVPESLKT